jgi:Domain of unknown function (DUF4419)
MCGLPAVTLEGSKSDWENILSRINKLDTFGTETKHWASMLRAVLTRFVRSFEVFGDDSKSTEEEKANLLEFWNQIAHYLGGGSGPKYLSSWITAFCPWNSEGKWIDATCAPGKELTPPPKVTPECRKEKEIFKPKRLRESGGSLVLDGQVFPILKSKEIFNPKRHRESGVSLVLDDQVFPIVKTEDVPNGYVEMDVKLDDNGAMFDAVMIAGQIGGRVLDLRNSEGDGGDGRGQDKLGVAAGWVMFVKR